jgi:hypothetical protein
MTSSKDIHHFHERQRNITELSRVHLRHQPDKDAAMPILTTAIVNFLTVLAIGIAVGVVFARSGTGFLGRARDSLSGVGVGTYALVGIAGSFIGFHLGVILGLLPQPLLLFVTALIGALITVWAWRR